MSVCRQHQWWEQHRLRRTKTSDVPVGKVVYLEPNTGIIQLIFLSMNPILNIAQVGQVSCSHLINGHPLILININMYIYIYSPNLWSEVQFLCLKSSKVVGFCFLDFDAFGTFGGAEGGDGSITNMRCGIFYKSRSWKPLFFSPFGLLGRNKGSPKNLSLRCINCWAPERKTLRPHHLFVRTELKWTYRSILYRPWFTISALMWQLWTNGKKEVLYTRDFWCVWRDLTSCLPRVNFFRSHLPQQHESGESAELVEFGGLQC